jgi:lysozyme
VKLRAQLEGFEAREHKAYPDPLTKGDPWTIGVGHTGPEVHQGLVWTDEQIDAALTADIAEATKECAAHFQWFASLNEPRQAVLIGMCFQMGMDRLLGFHRTLDCIRDQRYADAAEHMRQSVWARQTPKRCIRLAYQLESGEWQ